MGEILRQASTGRSCGADPRLTEDGRYLMSEEISMSVRDHRGKAARSPSASNGANVTITEPTEPWQYFWDPRYTRQQRSRFVEEARIAFEQTGKPFFAWRAVRQCLLRKDGQPRDPLPPSICEYLADVAVRFGWLALGVDFTKPGGRGFTASGDPAFVGPGKANTRRARELLPRVLGLTGKPGQSAIRTAHQHGRDFLLYCHYLALVGTGLKRSEAMQSLLRQAPGEKSDGVPRVLRWPGGPALHGFEDAAAARSFVRRMRKVYPHMDPHQYRVQEA